jgi:hypothetical protein
MELQIPAYLYGFNAAAQSVVLASTLLLIWFGVARLPTSQRERVTTGSLLSFGLLGWFALAYALGRQNVYWVPDNPTVPTLPLGILAPVIIGLVLMMRSARIARLIDALPLSWLVGVQFYRVLGGVFVVLWSAGRLPWQFALPAGIGDIATGILAVVVAGMLARSAAAAHGAARAWCLFGIGDLVVAVSMGALTSPGSIHFMALDAPNLLITAYPLVMIPTFAVPLSIILHGVCLWKLHRLRAVGRTSPARPPLYDD